MFERTRIDANGSESFSETPRNLNRVQRGAASLRRAELEGSRRGSRYRLVRPFPVKIPPSLSSQAPNVPVIPSEAKDLLPSLRYLRSRSLVALLATSP